MKKIIILLGAVLLTASCTYSSSENSGDYCVRFYIDPVTKVEYVIYYSGYGAGITTRINSDGTPYIKNSDEQNLIE